MSEDGDDEFRHVDFTVASDWEAFIKNLEEVIFEWKLQQVKIGPPLKKGDLEKLPWNKETKKEKIRFADVGFHVTRYSIKLPSGGTGSPVEEESTSDKVQALEDVMCLENDFPPQKEWATGIGKTTQHPHPLAVWYGLRDFVVITAEQDKIIATESRVKILLSSVYVAVNNTNCPVPVFVQVHKPTDHFYLGVCDGKEVRLDFEMVYLKRAPPHCRYLTGLVDAFKSKIASPVETVNVAVQFMYVLRDWTSSKWTQQPPDFDFLEGETIGVTDLGKLPFGATSDPISELHLFATWPKLVDTAVMDGESYSDFEASQAPEWSVQVKMAEQSACLLSDYLDEFIQLCSCKRTTRDLIGDMFDNDAGVDMSASLSALTDSRVPVLSRMLKRNKPRPKSFNFEGAISNEHLMPILYFLFPDAAKDSPNPYPETWEEQGREEFARMKTAPPDSLVWRLAVVMSHVLFTLGAVRAAAHLWYEFCGEMLYRWENAIRIPGVGAGLPSYRTGLLNQKLQMLNCCIERRLSREEQARRTSVELETIPAESEEEEEEEEEEDDEFFDCWADVPGPAAAAEGGGGPGRRRRRRQRHSLWNQPVGRQCRHANLLLVKTGDPLYVPVTQDPSPKTEDQVMEDVDVMVRLGSDREGRELRSRMMSASLLSDMESFKAANPGAILDDFIRWYSPRDWIEEEGFDEFGQRKGALSARMCVPGNIWLDVWEAAKPVPARRQKRLFDDTREAEKVLHFLRMQSPAQMAQLLLPVLVHAALERLTQEERPETEHLAGSVRRLASQAGRLSQTAEAPNLAEYEELARELTCIEEVIAQAKSLEHKFCPHGTPLTQTRELQAFLTSLMQSTQVAVPEAAKGLVGRKIRTMFAEAQKAAQMLSEYDLADSSEETWNSPFATNFPQPHQRQFVLRATAPRPAPYSTPCPQKMCVILQKDSFRMAGCFTEDVTFV